MQYRSETKQADNGAQVEIGTVIHEGREYSAMGSIIDEACGVIVGYVSKDELALRTWGGEQICELRVVSRFKAFGNPVTAYRCIYNGRRYSGRGSGPQMVLRLRARQ
jgi:hypothetical protein